MAQTLLFLGETSIQIIRSWLLLHVSSRMNIALISDFFIKLMALPIAFFDTKVTGNLIQRMRDHDRIRNLLTTTSLNVLFSLIQLLVLAPMLAFYSMKLFLIYLLGSTLYIAWILCFLKRRKALDYKAFTQASKEQSKVMELLNGMQEIKLHQAEQQKRWEWEYLQGSLFKLHTKSLTLAQIEGLGSKVIHELQHIGVTILAANLVIQGKLTLGMMMAVSYIMGQLRAPIAQVVQLIYAMQDTSIALERLAEIHNQPNEGATLVAQPPIILPLQAVDLVLDKISFRYKGKSTATLHNLSLTIPANRLTAIVGLSGSGKTTLMKLLLQFYGLEEGMIKVGELQLNHIPPNLWRDQCGVVMQEGFLFNATISHNIAIGKDCIDQERLRYAVEVAHIKPFIESLPLSYNTKVGTEGLAISTGEKQRLLIARAVYKNPNYLFFDEATSALDASNESNIMHDLGGFFQGRTTVVIAHRLSTVKAADQIVVLDRGTILERGNHQELIEKKGSYFNLVKNQLAMEA
ncbi:MAG: peptidase domain-containing ABC transporter [Amoebophilaceae bacterium]|nr:peptidase domain-containing ABC transporter [Amoebophilaceae bacterium]